METDNQMTQNTEPPAPAENEARLRLQLAETAGLPDQNRFVLPNAEIPVYVHYGPLPYILPADFQWKGPSSRAKRPKKKPARPHYN